MTDNFGFIETQGKLTIDHLETHCSQFCDQHGIDLHEELGAMLIPLFNSLNGGELASLQSVFKRENYEGLICGDCGHDNTLNVVRCRSCNAPVHTYK